jgi:hypothetical protein
MQSFYTLFTRTPDLTIPDADACTQWEHCGHLKPAHWVAETNEHASQAFLCAARALRDAGHLNRMPRRSCVLAFSRVALDLCAQPLVDARPGRSKLLGPAPPAGTIPRATPGIKGDLIGRLLARFDPIVRHAEQLAEPLEGHTAVFVYNKRRGAYIYDEQATCAANETEATDADVPDLASDGSSGSSDEPDHRPPSRQRAGIQGDGHGADEPAAADADEGVAVPVPASARRARSTCPATPPIVASVDVECVSSEGRPSLDDEQEERPPK